LICSSRAATSLPEESVNGSVEGIEAGAMRPR